MDEIKLVAATFRLRFFTQAMSLAVTFVGDKLQRYGVEDEPLRYGVEDEPLRYGVICSAGACLPQDKSCGYRELIYK